MIEQLQPPSVPSKRRYLGLWLVIAVVVTGVAVVVFTTPEKERPPVAAPSLKPGLLATSDFPAGVLVSGGTQDEFGEVLSAARVPSIVDVTGCARLLYTPELGDAGESAEVIRAVDVRTGTYYVQAVMPAGAVPSWNPRRHDALLADCGEATFTLDGTIITLHAHAVAGVEGEGYATGVVMDLPRGTRSSMAIAVTKVGAHIVMFAGVGPAVDEAEFVRLANAANDRVRTRL
jgi:hypothetical protein